MMIRLLICIFIATISIAEALEVGIAAVFKNEAPYLEEWIEYHRLLGVKHFWLYNHYSDDNYQQVLEKYIAQGIVDLENAEGHNNRVRNIQRFIYEDAIVKAKKTMDWLAIIDIDEFILPMRAKNIPDTITKYFPNASLIYVNWRQFGTSRKTLIHSNNMIPNLTSCSKITHPRNATGKGIVKLSDAAVDKELSPHFCPVIPNKLVFYGDGSLFDGDGKPFSRINDLITDGKHHDKYIRINHYFTRDEKFWNDVKLPRIRARGEEINIYLQQYKDFLETEDFTIIKFLQKKYPKFWRKYYGKF